VLVEGDRIAFELPLPVGGIMSRAPLTAVAERERAFTVLLQARGHAFHAPLFTLLFMAADFLPAVRLTALGVWDVKRARVITPSQLR